MGGQGSGSGTPLHYLPRPGGRGIPPATGPSRTPPRRGPSVQLTCRQHAEPPRRRNAHAPPAPAGSCSPMAYGGREGTTRLESAGGTTIPRGHRGAGGGGGGMRRWCPLIGCSLSRRGGTEPLLGQHCENLSHLWEDPEPGFCCCCCCLRNSRQIIRTAFCNLEIPIRDLH